MIKKSYILLILFSLSNFFCCVAQKSFYIRSDRKYNVANQYFCDSLQISEQDFQKIEIEFRIWKESWTTGIHKLIVLQKSYTGNWQGKSYEFYFYNDNYFDFQNIKIDTLAFMNTWAESWVKILKNNYLNIKNQSIVEKKYAKEINEKLIVADGKAYFFDILTKYAKRKFYYNNPESYYKFFLENNITEEKEYKKVLDLIQLLEDEFGLGTSLSPSR